MNGEKDLDQIENGGTGSEEGFGGLEDFVELDDLQNLEGLGDLSALGDISDLGDLSDLPGVSGTDNPEDLDVNIDIPLPVMEEQEGAGQLNEAATEPGAVPDIQEEAEEETAFMPEEPETINTEEPEETSITGNEEIPEEPGITEAMAEDGAFEEEPGELDLDINNSIGESVQEEDLAEEQPVILEKNVSSDAGEDIEEDISLDDITLDAGEDIVLEEDAIEQDTSPGGITEDIIQKESLPEETARADDGSEIDSMLDGLLDNIDINGSLDDGAASSGTAGMEDSDGDDMLDGMLDSLGIPEAISSEDTENNIVKTRKKPPRELPLDEPGSEESEKKPGFFKRIFGNVVTDEIAEAERKAKEEEEEQAALKAEEEAKAKEEKEAKKAAAAEAKEAKKAEKAAKKAEKAEQKAAKKAEKAAKKEAEKEEEEQEVVGKLNKAGVTVVVVGAAAILAGVILGTNVFGYNSSKSEAERYFTLQRYSDAYNEARGTKLEDKDPELYDKIVTVMKVQQSLDTYSSYAGMKYYPDALNALLRGLQKYDENIDMAMDLEIEGDMKVCKNRILSILKDEFGLSEQKAYEILSLDESAYTKRVVGIAKKKI